MGHVVDVGQILELGIGEVVHSGSEASKTTFDGHLTQTLSEEDSIIGVDRPQFGGRPVTEGDADGRQTLFCYLRHECLLQQAYRERPPYSRMVRVTGGNFICDGAAEAGNSHIGFWLWKA
jgi:hypothetical protein